MNALFLDCDGVLIKDQNYLRDPDLITVNQEIIPLLHEFQKKQYGLFVLTNQAGIAKGKMTIKEYLQVKKGILRKFKEHGIIFTDWRYCPFHPEGNVEEFKLESNWRKPGRGMIDDLLSLYDIDLDHSLMIGDRESDQLDDCGKMKFYLARGQYGIETVKPQTLVFENLSTLVNYLLEHY